MESISRSAERILTAAWRAILVLLLAFGLSPAVPLSSATAFAAEAAKPDSGEEAEVEPVADVLGRTSPRSMQIALFDALGTGEIDAVAPYIEGADPSDVEARTRIAAFMTALDQQGSLSSRLALSLAPEGRADDGLAPDLEAIGSIALDDGELPVLIRRVPQEEGEPIWLISTETLDAIPLPEKSDQAAEDGTPQSSGLMLFGAPLSTWLLLTAGGLSMFATIVLIFKLAGRRLGIDPHSDHSPITEIVLAVFPPLALMTVYAVIEHMSEPLGAGLVERTAISRYSGIAIGVAVIWLAWRVAGVINRLVIRWLRRHDQPAWIGLSNFVTRLFRLALVAFAIAVLLATFAIDVTTWLAALGIGGLALALGARKAVEDIVGSVSLLADKPLRIGDRCRVDGFEGDVMDIGMRSTRIQTLDRTMLTIPNSKLADQNIENLAMRDRFWVEQRFAMPFSSGPALVRKVLAAARDVLAANPHYLPTACPIRFEGFSPSGYDFHLRCYLDAPTHDEGFLRQEAMLLTMLERFEELGATVVPATQRIEFVQGGAEGTGQIGVFPDPVKGQP